jgi:hypothetical protein
MYHSTRSSRRQVREKMAWLRDCFGKGGAVENEVIRNSMQAGYTMGIPCQVHPAFAVTNAGHYQIWSRRTNFAV